MTNAEFIQATTRLENYYDKEYTTEQLKIMFDFLRGWTVEKYMKAINFCLKNNKFLPKIADLTNAEIDNNQTQNKEKIDFIKCKKSNGEGFIKYWKSVQNGDKTIKYEYIALCTCDNANRQKTINRYDLPTLSELGM